MGGSSLPDLDGASNLIFGSCRLFDLPVILRFPFRLSPLSLSLRAQTSTVGEWLSTIAPSRTTTVGSETPRQSNLGTTLSLCPCAPTTTLSTTSFDGPFVVFCCT
ncbi:hypothetical protein B0T18DRAFT_405014 [Schizothecium vesticola]|uniref:Uncharacterized protein n=1 Tax=Schizothecium vesticola TaxID=314040 RepID=A0AA40F7D3_9PEZI|nr:hypothetical protein B0T18DRAFT_405014 [Schizothecium vesticola]